jgi:hypothetical protein
MNLLDLVPPDRDVAVAERFGSAARGATAE